jgi:drug/metabolite transporter (DMT)-like permease
MAQYDFYFYFLAIAMTITGSINTITTKLADIQKSEGIDGDKEEFNHPFVQAVGMFMGEFLCLIAFKALWAFNKVTDRPNKEVTPFNPLIFVLPAICDMTATSCMYVGLNWTYASVFQMLRGSVIIFTGIFSVLFLKRKLKGYHWLGMLFVLAGLFLVGIASIFQG